MTTSTQTVKTLLVMAGGTGGHVFPALAVAKELQTRGADVAWLGTRRGLESKVIPDNGISMEWVSVEGLRGKNIISLLLAPFKLLRAVWQSAAAIRRVNPDCILGMGGFVAGPGGVAARLMGRSLVVHEQNAVAGLTNKYLAKIASKVLTGFPAVEDLPANAQWVGNPVREDIVPATASSSRDGRINVLIVGGSQGAHSFNQQLPTVFAQLLEQHSIADVDIWHQTGRGRSSEVIASYATQKVEARVTEFIDDMAEAYAWADLLICRAGAMTIAECCAAAKPALLIPYPFSAGDHQVKNAQAMVAVGAGKMLYNEQISQAVMIETLTGLLSDKSELVYMGEQALSLHKANALQSVVSVCEEYLHA